MRKSVFGVSDQVRHKPGCIAAEDCKKLDFSESDRRGIIHFTCSENNGAEIAERNVFTTTEHEPNA